MIDWSSIVIGAIVALICTFVLLYLIDVQGIGAFFIGFTNGFMWPALILYGKELYARADSK